MALPVMDERHQEVRRLVQLVSVICLSEEFLTLRKELESLYLKFGNEPAPVLAFQDALYSLMAQEEVDFRRVRGF
jgi:hypothetical protein